MAHFYEMTVFVRTDEPKGADAFNAAVDRVASRLDGHAMHRFTEIAEGEAPLPLRDSSEEEE